MKRSEEAVKGATNLKSARIALGLSVEGLLALLGDVGRRTLERWESGGAPTPHSIVVLLDLLQRSPEARSVIGLEALQAQYPVRGAGRPKGVKPAA